MGARTCTVTTSHGLLYLMEAVYNALGLRLSIFMTINWAIEAKFARVDRAAADPVGA